MTVCGSVTGAKLLSSKKLLSEPDVYCPPNSQFVFIEKARSVGCSPVRVMPPTSAISGSAATPAPPIRLACSTVRREIRRLAAASRSPGLSSALTPADSAGGACPRRRPDPRAGCLAGAAGVRRACLARLACAVPVRPGRRPRRRPVAPGPARRRAAVGRPWRRARERRRAGGVPARRRRLRPLRRARPSVVGRSPGEQALGRAEPPAGLARPGSASAVRRASDLSSSPAARLPAGARCLPEARRPPEPPARTRPPGTRRPPRAATPVRARPPEASGWPRPGNALLGVGSCSALASVMRGSASGARGPPSAPAGLGTAPASAVPGSVSASQVMSSLPPEPVLRSSASGLALPSSVAGRDGTRLKYRPGLALRTNSRVVRKCPAPRSLWPELPTIHAIGLYGPQACVQDQNHRCPGRGVSGPGGGTRQGLKMSDPRVIFEQTSKTTGHPSEFRFE